MIKILRKGESKFSPRLKVCVDAEHYGINLDNLKEYALNTKLSTEDIVKLMMGKHYKKDERNF